MRIVLVGYPGDLGGACTEVCHTIRLWQQAGWQVELLPTWTCDPAQQETLRQQGVITHLTQPECLDQVPGLPGTPVVSFCNGAFIQHAHRFRALGCPIIWANCMTFLFDHEKQFFQHHGLPEAMVFQSHFQRSQLAPQLVPYGYHPEQGYLIRGAWCPTEEPFAPRPHRAPEPFVVGRHARPDPDKWSSNTWRIYEKIAFRQRQALVLGVDEPTLSKLGPTPAWASILRPRAIPTRQFLAALHCLLPVNGGARENWPRAGLEAMAAGVPVVAQNAWGWTEMIEHGVTGFLGDCDEELAHYAAVLAYDERLRLQIAHAARQRLREELASPEPLIEAWRQLFANVTAPARTAA